VDILRTIKIKISPYSIKKVVMDEENIEYLKKAKRQWSYCKLSF